MPRQRTPNSTEKDRMSSCSACLAHRSPSVRPVEVFPKKKEFPVRPIQPCNAFHVNIANNVPTRTSAILTLSLRYVLSVGHAAAVKPKSMIVIYVGLKTLTCAMESRHSPSEDVSSRSSLGPTVSCVLLELQHSLPLPIVSLRLRNPVAILLEGSQRAK